MRILHVAILISFYLTTFCSETVFAQSLDFKGYFVIQNYRNQKGIQIDSIKDVFLKTSKGTFFVKDCNNLLPSTNELHLKKVILRGNFEKGPLDFCNVNGVQQSRFGEHIILEDLVMESSFSYTLSDGSGNRYILEGSVLKYIPVTKELSSSGMYDKTMKKTRLASCEKGRSMASIAIRFSQLGEDKEYCCEENKRWSLFIKRNKLLLE